MMGPPTPGHIRVRYVFHGCVRIGIYVFKFKLASPADIDRKQASPACDSRRSVYETRWRLFYQTRALEIDFSCRGEAAFIQSMSTGNGLQLQWCLFVM